MTFKQMFTSSIGKKFVMALTGISLILFLIVHVGLNATIWANDGGRMFNAGANFMGSMLVIRLMEIGLFAGIILHIIQGYLLTVENNSRRKVGYAVDYGNRGSKWYSRSMGLLGTLILLFLIMHIWHFWVPSRLGGIGGVEELQVIHYESALGSEYHNLYAKMVEVFQSPVVVILYVLGCISLAYHLMHGFESAFRTIGIHNNRYLIMLRMLGRGFSIVVCAAFAMMPISMYLGWVK
ncbi:succinate dehydrogenase cytochrome b subunit [Aridibaculum aurantiacum]|uniref:succinate dehydrogenase cytochrome b subunit n=1 Tax=Aridibaculum aurantiacum TaxID=2810307 RepID=UPI001A97769A|nr:succinate dehydrogenase cytochrome b subunit [Aridibaculum aurantiacum]